MALILVTGAASGLGLNTATELARQGHDVVVHARNAPRVPAGARWRGTITGDLADLEQTRDVAYAANEYGRFDVVIHNAGALHRPDAVPVNTIAPYVLTAEMSKPGRLICLSSSKHRGGSTDVRGMTSGTVAGGVGPASGFAKHCSTSLTRDRRPTDS